jgi:hypothetical protein
MLTPWVAHRVSLTLQSISGIETDFGGRAILFVGDFLQLPPVVEGCAIPVPYRLITRLSSWNSIRKFRLRTPLRTPDPRWVDFLMNVATGEQPVLGLRWIWPRYLA